MAAWLCATTAFGCGGWFPNELLADGGRQLLAAPEASFRQEIEAMHLINCAYQAVGNTNGFAAEAAEAELAELRIALTRSGHSATETAVIIQQHTAQRDQLAKHGRAFNEWQASLNPWLPTTNPPPVLAPNSVSVTAGLPGEFADYFRGAIAWHAGQTNEARAAWQTLLNRPAAERHFRSTWAAFMLGKATWETDPKAASKHFREVRSLASRGFADSIGLAASSLGWEGRIALRRDDFAGAVDLYLEQAAAGDNSAYNSLRFTASEALTRGRTLLPNLAANPRAQAVITAYVIAGGWTEPAVNTDGVIYKPIANLLDKQRLIPPPAGGWHRFESPVRFWLDAVEEANVRDVPSAEKLALAAYQAGEINLATRWVKRATNSPTAQWLEAKLFLREGKVEQAAAALAQLTRQFPPATDTETNAPAQTNLLFRLSSGMRLYELRNAPIQIQAEFGALRLTRREYTEALDALLRSRYWEDAAYFADRVLTLEELVTYIDRNWPDTDTSDDEWSNMRRQIRTLLGLRLVRLGHFQQARPYLPTFEQTVLDQYVQAITLGRDPTRSNAERAATLWRGAQAVFANYGLFMPPVGTDWSVSSGLFVFNPTPPERLKTGGTPQYLPASGDERQRVATTAVHPDRSWYYRFIAAGLAWEAAQLMPDNTDETAHVLWQAGTWIKYTDPDAADVFYKALVNRCRQTALGEAADRRRWFPLLDKEGNIVPFKSRAPQTQASASNDRPPETHE